VDFTLQFALHSDISLLWSHKEKLNTDVHGYQLGCN